MILPTQMPAMTRLFVPRTFRANLTLSPCSRRRKDSYPKVLMVVYAPSTPMVRKMRASGVRPA